MPCRPDERFAQGPAQPKATTRTRLTLNGGASCEEPEAEDPVEHEPEKGDVIDGDGEAGDQPKKRHVDIQHQIQLAAREMMHDFEVCLEYTEIFFYSFLHWHNSTVYY